MEGFLQDERGCWAAKVNEGSDPEDTITLTVSVHGDSIFLEQAGDHQDNPDLVAIKSRSEAQQIIEHLQTWIDSE